MPAFRDWVRRRSRRLPPKAARETRRPKAGSFLPYLPVNSIFSHETNAGSRSAFFANMGRPCSGPS